MYGGRFSSMKLTERRCVERSRSVVLVSEKSTVYKLTQLVFVLLQAVPLHAFEPQTEVVRLASRPFT